VASRHGTTRDVLRAHDGRAAGTHYPATLLLTGDRDDRVVPGHSFKFAAALQAAQAGGEPILIRVDTAAGHGAGKPTAKRIAADTDVLTFLAAVLPGTAG
jgi:prolyl oligopeptidase